MFPVEHLDGHVGVTTVEDADRHFREIEAKLGEMGLPFDGVLAAEMLPAGRELVIGGHLDPTFGPVVIVGDGGVAVEAMPDNHLLLTPFDHTDVAAALSRLRIGPLFRGVRGAPPLSVEAVHEAATSVAALLEDGKVLSVDINPLIVTPDGATAADALIEIRAD